VFKLCLQAIDNQDKQAVCPTTDPGSLQIHNELRPAIEILSRTAATGMPYKLCALLNGENMLEACTTVARYVIKAWTGIVTPVDWDHGPEGSDDTAHSYRLVSIRRLPDVAVWELRTGLPRAKDVERQGNGQGY
jgi:hypothetical protein